MTTASETLAAFVAALDAADAGPALARKAKNHLLDTIGVACAGLADARARTLASLVRRWGGAGEAGVVGLDARLPAPKAAFLNALNARLHTFDDTYEAGPSHPGSAVVAGALAGAEVAGASGRALLAALLAGYEVATRVTAALGAGHYAHGFQGTGTCAPFAAAAAAARAVGLDAARTAGALGLAGEAAIGLRQYQVDGSMLDTALNGARGAEAGVGAVEMAAAGLAGPRGILDGRWGLLRVMAGGAPDILADGLGRRWEFGNVVAKPYASCRFTHGPVEALAKAGLDADRVEAVEIATFRASVEVSDRPDPRSRDDAILSHQVACAMALLGRPILPADYDAIPGPDPGTDRVRALAARVRVRHDPALDAAYPARWPHRVTVTLAGGGRVELYSERPPAADGTRIRAKFRALAAPVLGGGRADEVVAVVDALETLPDACALVRLLGPPMAEAA